MSTVTFFDHDRPCQAITTRWFLRGIHRRGGVRVVYRVFDPIDADPTIDTEELTVDLVVGSIRRQ